MYRVRRIGLLNLLALCKVCSILYRCGKNMAEKNGLQHWNNSYLKTLAIVFLCALKNKIYLVYDGKRAIATFQTKKTGDALRFQKLATDPRYAGKGVGSFCLNEIESVAKAMGCARVCLEVYDKSAHAREFYEHRNYVVCGEVSTLKYTELQMEKKL